MRISRLTAIFLILSATNLAFMVPGGFVETRSFPDYSVTTLAAFNVFLTLLGIGSFVLAYRIFRAPYATYLPVLAGLSYLGVYGLDLAHIFPVATAPMSALLETMEWFGIALGAATVAVAIAYIIVADRSVSLSRKMPRWAVIAMAGSTLAIVIFATLSAM